CRWIVDQDGPGELTDASYDGVADDSSGGQQVRPDTAGQRGGFDHIGMEHMDVETCVVEDSFRDDAAASPYRDVGILTVEGVVVGDEQSDIDTEPILQERDSPRDRVGELHYVHRDHRPASIHVPRTRCFASMRSAAG